MIYECHYCGRRGTNGYEKFQGVNYQCSNVSACKARMSKNNRAKRDKK